MVKKPNKQQQQQHLQQRPSAATDRSSMNPSGSYVDNTFCVVLHVVEAINFYGREVQGERDQIIMNAALNTVDFEVEGTPSVTTETIIFNSNCIWECDMAGIKRIKTDHRPVKVTFFACNAGSTRKTIGSLLLPVRGIPVLGVGGNNSPLQLKMFWHKLICISSEFRSHKPEVLLMLAIIKKSLLHTKDFKHLMVFNSAVSSCYYLSYFVSTFQLNRQEKQPRGPPLQSPGHSITANMLQSQANVYVQSLVQLGLLQVGNNPLVDCDIIEVVLQFKQLKNLNKFVKSLFQGREVNTVVLMFDFVGNVTNIELKLNESDCYILDDVLGLRFKSSLNSIRLYFQRIFYLPINMYIKGTSIANYRMDFAKMLPSNMYFTDQRKYTQSGSFAFERFGRMGSARELKPIMEYTFSVDIQEVCWRQHEGQPDVPRLPQKEQQSDQLNLHCASSKAVIHEVPKDRVNESVGDCQSRNPDKHSNPENVSITSLNVGAELSDSDERESVGESPLRDVSKLEVTVHMFDQTKAAGAETPRQVVDMDVSNMDESLKQILAATMGLQGGMQLKALEYLRSLAHQSAQIPLGKHSQTTANNEANSKDANYNVKFKELEEHIVVLEDHLHQFESRTLKMQEENMKLVQEKMQLRQRICHMEQQIEALRNGQSNGSELKHMLNEMRNQNVRFQNIAKARDHYKKQWRHAAKRIHVLKLAIYEKNVQHQYGNMESNVLNLKSILTKNAEEFEREYGRFRNTAVSFSGSNESSEPLLKDYLRGLSTQTVGKHIPVNRIDSTRMH
ncbi:hypothetical protein KR044_007797 [Drosophila immigrans]|nr:hypothetical protein KR044_007797 [Drosophila immigrans]